MIPTQTILRLITLRNIDNSFDLNLIPNYFQNEMTFSSKKKNYGREKTHQMGDLH